MASLEGALGYSTEARFIRADGGDWHIIRGSRDAQGFVWFTACNEVFDSAPVGIGVDGDACDPFCSACLADATATERAAVDELRERAREEELT